VPSDVGFGFPIFEIKSSDRCRRHNLVNPIALACFIPQVYINSRFVSTISEGLRFSLLRCARCDQERPTLMRAFFGFSVCIYRPNVIDSPVTSDESAPGSISFETVCQFTDYDRNGGHELCKHDRSYRRYYRLWVRARCGSGRGEPRALLKLWFDLAISSTFLGANPVGDQHNLDAVAGSRFISSL